MQKQFYRVICSVLCVTILLFVLNSCVLFESDERPKVNCDIYLEDDNYVEFAASIKEVGDSDNERFKWLELQSESDVLNFNYKFAVVTVSYHDLLRKGFDLTSGEQEYIFIATKQEEEDTNLSVYYIVSIKDKDGKVYLRNELGKNHLYWYKYVYTNYSKSDAKYDAVKERNYYEDESNYIQFVGNIISLDMSKSISLKCSSKNEQTNVDDIVFKICERNYYELLRTDFNLTVSESEYSFIAVKDDYYDYYHIVAITDMSGKQYLIKEIGIYNLRIYNIY